jgi:hypothetical protein
MSPKIGGSCPIQTQKQGDKQPTAALSWILACELLGNWTMWEKKGEPDGVRIFLEAS